jgi:HD-GYP domain-containing protein (c-di-GMP phosphodiesterase class II)
MCQMTNEECALEEQFHSACEELRVSTTNRVMLASFLAPLRNKHPVTHFHYAHSLRVGLLARQIGRFTYHNEKPLLFAGALHDLGKCQTPLEILGKTESWGDADQKAMQAHVMDGYKLLRGRFDVTAEIMLWHHKFQEDGYPEELPPHLHQYRETMQLLIREYGRIVALADVYDALHRTDAKHGEKVTLTSEQIKEKMFELNPDRTILVEALYKQGLLV